jgi:hypothetical protein
MRYPTDVTQALCAHSGNAKVMGEACGAIDNLAFLSPHDATLGNEGCDAVVRALLTHLYDT